ncbi:hypothetical protein BWQ96_08400 [Gracilariopsis chorda]|uniref:Uncharacterized protein n=1 Tax=Gracilariopsis chorda TaxID=448386 RepID=A0A2V3IID6_9FLOR|nr:hypothetical protein BWQ96_08400 [Gracilariopsis chorda]|eukprot:PXF41865.1 hypothetical protein BWQ96_08400 [Gracilariopsis chorda]
MCFPATTRRTAFELLFANFDRPIPEIIAAMESRMNARGEVDKNHTNDQGGVDLRRGEKRNRGSVEEVDQSTVDVKVAKRMRR